MKKQDSRARMKAFKFMSSDYVEPFLELGSMKIGSIDEYREPDGKTGARADERDSVTYFEPGAGRLDHIQKKAFTKSFRFTNEPSVDFLFDDGASFIINETGYVFCASRYLTSSLIRKMQAKFDCDACVEISDLRAFAERVTAAVPALQNPIPGTSQNCQVDRVNYRDLKAKSRFPEGDVWTKDNDYSWQKELRIYWKGQAPHQSFYPEVPDVKDLLERIDLNKWK